MEPGGKACLYYPDAQWRHYSEKTNFIEFVNKVVTPFFWGQVYFDKKGKWPYPARAHFDAGALDYYKEELGVESPFIIVQFLDDILRPHISGHRSCPCGSNKRYRHCHRGKIFFLRSKIPNAKIQTSINRIKFDFFKEHKKAEAKQKSDSLIKQAIKRSLTNDR